MGPSAPGCCGGDHGNIESPAAGAVPAPRGRKEGNDDTRPSFMAWDAGVQPPKRLACGGEAMATKDILSGSRRPAKCGGGAPVPRNGAIGSLGPHRGGKSKGRESAAAGAPLHGCGDGMAPLHSADGEAMGMAGGKPLRVAPIGGEISGSVIPGPIEERIVRPQEVPRRVVVRSMGMASGRPPSPWCPRWPLKWRKVSRIASRGAPGREISGNIPPPPLEREPPQFASSSLIRALTVWK